jgi:hypothetical protein
VDNNTTAFDAGGNIIVKAGANLTTPNIGAATGTSISLTGDVTAANLYSNGLISATGNLVGGNVNTSGLVSATGNAYVPAIVNNGAYNTQVALGASTGIIAIETNGNATGFGPSGTISLSGASQILGGVFAGSGVTLGASQTDIFQNRGGNVTVQLGTGGTIANTWTFAQSGAFLAPGAISASGNITTGNVLTGGQVSATGNVTGGNILYGSGIVSGTGNVYGGNILQGSFQVLDTASTIDGGQYT